MKFDFKKVVQDFQWVKIPALAMILYGLIGELIFHKICLFRILWGIPCPGCGITRALFLAIQGNFLEATKMHPLWIVLVIGVPVVLLERYLVLSEQTTKRIKRINRIVLYILMAVFLVFYIYRMVVYYPNSAPMVYDSDNIREFILRIFQKKF
ncbi:MAG: DUF2752 domain-containing protein [Eubacterium sp.]|nr:DUF2752 domain-containing protein [Eubacterium sp.]